MGGLSCILPPVKLPSQLEREASWDWIVLFSKNWANLFMEKSWEVKLQLIHYQVFIQQKYTFLSLLPRPGVTTFTLVDAGAITITMLLSFRLLLLLLLLSLLLLLLLLLLALIMLIINWDARMMLKRRYWTSEREAPLWSSKKKVYILKHQQDRIFELARQVLQQNSLLECIFLTDDQTNVVIEVLKICSQKVKTVSYLDMSPKTPVEASPCPAHPKWPCPIRPVSAILALTFLPSVKTRAKSAKTFRHFQKIIMGVCFYFCLCLSCFSLGLLDLSAIGWSGAFL